MKKHIIILSALLIGILIGGITLLFWYTDIEIGLSNWSGEYYRQYAYCELNNTQEYSTQSINEAEEDWCEDIYQPNTETIEETLAPTETVDSIKVINGDTSDDFVKEIGLKMISALTKKYDIIDNTRDYTIMISNSQKIDQTKEINSASIFSHSV